MEYELPTATISAGSDTPSIVSLNPRWPIKPSTHISESTSVASGRKTPLADLKFKKKTNIITANIGGRKFMRSLFM